MKYLNFFKKLDKKINAMLASAVAEKCFPSAVAGISFFKNDIWHNYFASCGNKKNKNIIYDLASLTKPLATTLSVLSLVKDKIIKYEDTLPNLLEMEVGEDKKNITLEYLLSHSSGIPSYKPYYEKLVTIEKLKKEKLLSFILKEELLSIPGKKQLYSDLGFILLERIIKIKSGSDISSFVKNKIFDPVAIKSIFFNKNDHIRNDKEYAPTEICPWRKKQLCGQVHDENAYAIGGISGHAGLFGDIFDVTKLVTLLADIINERCIHPHIEREDIKKAVKKYSNKGTFGLGFDTPSKLGSSSGSYFSTNSFGHLGFTGTSFWVDMDKQLVVVLLTNRVNPKRSNEKIRNFRPIFHDEIIILYNKYFC